MLSFAREGGEHLQDARRRLFDRLRREVGDEAVIDAMERVPREAFVPEEGRAFAYEDVPLPIGEDQTISQPFIVATMVSGLALRRSDRVLEVGTGSGYQAAILSLLAQEVLTVERIASLADSARERVAALGFANVRVELAGGTLGWPEEEPYDAIIVAAAAPKLPQQLLDQMGVGARFVVPVGSLDAQELMKIYRTSEGISVHMKGACRFVPLIGEGAWDEDRLKDLE